MFRIARHRLLAAVAPVILSASLLSAAPPAAPAPAPMPPQQQSAVETQNATINKTGITSEKLFEILGNMGYEPKVVINDQGLPYASLIFDRAGWTFSMTIALSADGSNIWFSSPLSEITDKDKLDPAALLKLLEQNSKLSPAYFNFRPESQNRIYLSESMANCDMTVAKVRAKLDEFIGNIQDTYALWDPAKLNAGSASASAK